MLGHFSTLLMEGLIFLTACPGQIPKVEREGSFQESFPQVKIVHCYPQPSSADL